MNTNLICVEDGTVLSNTGCYCKNTLEKVHKGKIYTGIFRKFDDIGDDVWFIEETGVFKLANRFIPVSEYKNIIYAI